MTIDNPKVQAMVPVAAEKKVKHVFRSLAKRNYRLYFSGQLISLIGTWMQQLALSWLTYRLTQSPFMLGAMAFASLGPTILLGPFGTETQDANKLAETNTEIIFK